MQASIGKHVEEASSPKYTSTNHQAGAVWSNRLPKSLMCFLLCPTNEKKHIINH